MFSNFLGVFKCIKVYLEPLQYYQVVSLGEMRQVFVLHNAVGKAMLPDPFVIYRIIY